MNFARIVDGVAIDVSAAPAEAYHPIIAEQFVAVPDEVMAGWRLDGEEWSPPAADDPAPAAPVASVERRMVLTPPEFLLLFTSAERSSIRLAREYAGEDEARRALAHEIDDWWRIVTDARLTAVDLTLPQVREGLDLLASAGALTDERRVEIGLGLAA